MRQRQRGATLVEILISLAVVLVGMVAMFRVLASSVVGSSSASHVSQAQFRAEIILEAIRAAPAAAVTCLAGTPAAQWSNCEATCRATLGAATANQACIFTVSSMNALTAPNIAQQQTGTSEADGLMRDRNQQSYALVATGLGLNNRDSFVNPGGLNGRAYDVQVTVGWRDDNDPLKSVTTPDHAVTLNSGVFQ